VSQTDRQQTASLPGVTRNFSWGPKGRNSRPKADSGGRVLEDWAANTLPTSYGVCGSTVGYPSEV